MTATGVVACVLEVAYLGYYGNLRVRAFRARRVGDEEQEQKLRAQFFYFQHGVLGFTLLIALGVAVVVWLT